MVNDFFIFDNSGSIWSLFGYIYFVIKIIMLLFLVMSDVDDVKMKIIVI